MQKYNFIPNNLLNIAFLTADSNRKISDQAPSDYICKRIMDADIECIEENILNTNLLPLNKNIYLEDNYNNFIENRSEIIEKYIVKQFN